LTWTARKSVPFGVSPDRARSNKTVTAVAIRSIVLAVMAALAESYIDNLSEETSKGKRARAAAGLPNGDLPYGYANPEVGESGQSNRNAAVIVPERAEAVRVAFATYATGQSSDARIAGLLNERGYRIVSKWQPAGGPFGKDTISALLANPFYAGWVPQPSGTGGSNRGAEALLVRGKHEAIISQDTFDTVQEVRAARRGQGRTGSTAGTNHHRDGQLAVYVAAGLVRCRHCTERLRVQPTGRTPSFRDASRERGITCPAHRRSIPMPIVDATVDRYMAAIRLPDDWRRHAVSLLPNSGDEMRRVATARAAVERKLERATRLVLDGDIDQPTYRAERTRLEADLAGLVMPTEAGDGEAATVLLGTCNGSGPKRRPMSAVSWPHRSLKLSTATLTRGKWLPCI
jgi:hypothetical protein